MPTSPATMPHVVGVRLTTADHHKLQTLCARMQRPTSDVLRLLIRTAQAVDVPPVRFDAAPTLEVPCAAE